MRAKFRAGYYKNSVEGPARIGVTRRLWGRGGIVPGMVWGGGLIGAKTYHGRSGKSYAVKKLLSDEGGMGTVYIVRETENGQEYVLKEIRDFGTEHQSEAYDRFRREFSIMAKVNSKHVVKLIDLDPHPTPKWFIMEYIKGGSLAELIEKGKKVSPIVAGKLISQAIQGLIDVQTAVNQQDDSIKFSHRDIKPENIMVEINPQTKKVRRAVVIDFGIAKDVDKDRDPARGDLTKPGMVYGTPGYIAPWIMHHGSKGADPRVDNYSLGRVLHWIVTAEEKDSTIRPQYVSPEMWDVILKATSSDPNQVYLTYQEFKAAIDAVFR
jgi:serine/threonine protein kinase